MKRIGALLLAVALVFSLQVPTLAADSQAIQSAYTLYALGLFKGVSENEDGTPVFALDESLTRAQGVTLLLRLLGKEAEAQGSWSTPFGDIQGSWAEDSIGYAYTMGYIKGVTTTEFQADGTLTRQQFATMVLRSLGYQESNGDFTYDQAETFAASLGLSVGEGSTLTRGDAAVLCCSALTQTYKGTEASLLWRLVSAGTVTKTQAQQAGYGAWLEETSLSGSTSNLTAQEVYAACAPAVFYLEVYDASGQALRSGSGFFLTSDGVAVTNYHVIEGAASAKITLSQDGSVYDVAGVYSYDADRDVALLQIQGSAFPYLSLGDSDSVQSGETVYAIGSPLGLDNTISQGIISNASRVVDGQVYLQTSAAISSGSSGGALIDASGQVIGITSATFSEGQNLNLAVPINAVKTMERTAYVSLTELSATTSQEAALSLSQTSVTLSQGQWVEVTITCSGDWAYLQGIVGNPMVCQGQWISRNGDTAVLRLYGRMAGTTQVTISLTDLYGTTLASQTVQVAVS